MRCNKSALIQEALRGRGGQNWAQGAEGRIFTEEFFGVWTASPGAAMTYLGIDRVFQPITAKVWTGSAWILRKIRFWSGAAGVLT